MDEFELEKNGEVVNRSKSFIFNRNSDIELSKKYKTIPPSLLVRLKSIVIEDRDADSGTPLDDLICLDSYAEASLDDEKLVVINKQGIKAALQELLKNGGSHCDVLADLNSTTIDIAERVFSDYSHFERNVALLAAAFFNRNDLIQLLFNINVDKEFFEPNLGLGALHIAAFMGYPDVTRVLIRTGSNVNALHGTYTPLHCAALGDNENIAKQLLQAGAVLMKAIPNGQSPLHSAIYAQSVSCLKLFVEANADVNAADSSGITPLHLAADLGQPDSTLILLESNDTNIQKTSKTDENTPLHLAAQGGSYQVVKLLLDHGASPNVINARHKTPLHFSSRVCLESTKLLLRAGANSNAADMDQRTPLHSAVSRSEVRYGPEITSLLLDWNAEVNKQDRYGYTPLHIAALNELTESVQCLVRHGADVSARTKGGTAALGLMARKTPSALPAVKLQLDTGIFCSDPDVSYREVKLSFNFKYLLQGCGRGDMNFLQTFVNEGQRELLEHPLCEAFLHIKWEKIRKYYAFRVLFGCLLVVLLSIYSLTALAYQCYNEKIVEEPDVKSRIADIEFDASLCSNKSRLGLWLRKNPQVIKVEWSFLMLFTILEILRKLIGLQGYKTVREYFTLGNVIEWFVVVAVFATSYVFTKTTRPWQNHIGAFAVLFGWSNIMVMIGNLPMFGSYVAMYTKVQKEFAKLLSAYLCLLIGFTFAFCAIFVTSREFENPLVGFVKILVMMTGEFEFDSLLDNIALEGKSTATSSTILKASALITFVLFLLFVNIILINLLIGIAVHDIQGLKKTAGLSKLVGLTNLISHIESALFGPRVPGCVHKLLNASCGIPRKVETVRPLNPHEKRLPREIMRAGLDIARQARSKRLDNKKTNSICPRRDTEQASNDYADIIVALTAEVRELKEIVMNLKR